MSAILYKDELIGGSKDPFPVATILPFASKSYLPAGFMTCEGQAISRAMYPDLFRAIGTEYGAGDGETTFNLPDLTKAAWLNGTYDKTVFAGAGTYTFIAPKSGYYKITVKGAGGGGAGGTANSSSVAGFGGGGGGEGGTTSFTKRMNIGTEVSISVGAGGIGGTSQTNGSDGESSTVTVFSETHIAGGGNGGNSYNSGGLGGTGTVIGCSGGSGSREVNVCGGGNGGGNGGDVYTAASDGVDGGGGGGSASGNYAGAVGGDGYCWIEFIGTTPFYIIKTFGTQSNDSALIDMTQYATALAEKADKADGVPLGVVLPFSGNGNLPAGYLLCDGSAVSRSMYEDLFGVIGTTYGEGDGVSTFNLPDLGFLMPSVSLSGQPTVWLANDATKRDAGNPPSAAAKGLSWSSGGGATADPAANGTYGFTDLTRGDASGTSEESLTVRYIIKAFNGMNTHGALLDLTGMANELNRKYDARTDFCIIYPNGGTRENPANVTVNSRYVVDNPFPGYYVECVAEVYYNGKWGAAPDDGDPGSGSYGVGVMAYDFDNSIVIQTGRSVLLTSSASASNPFNLATTITTAPCRIKVWKIGKI